MAVYRVDFLCDDPEPIFKWQNENILPGSIIRSIAYKTERGWYIKTVFKRQVDAIAYHEYVYPDASDHLVSVFGLAGETKVEKR